MTLRLPIATLLVAAAVSAAIAQETPPTASPEADSSIRFPEPTKSWIPRGRFIPADNIRQVTPGLTKAQIYPLLGEPHFSNPVPWTSVWNYLIDFHTGKGDQVVQCAYQIRFSGRPMVVAATYWKDPACQRFLDHDAAASPGSAEAVDGAAPAGY